jgi:pantoate--beta-alanine ligase
MSDLPSPPIVRSVAGLRAAVGAWRAQGERVAFVPTLGSLHEGHLSLARLGRAQADRLVASVFVNPTQFAAGEDFAAYPRDEARDAALLAGVGCDLLYAPSIEEMYPAGFATAVTVSGVTEPLDGQSRPTHFAGVATVVAKLLIQCAPDVAIFGEKDYQQLLVIRRLARDLDLPVEIIGAPTVRDADGLALSSRNLYLSAAERPIAGRLNQVLKTTAEALAAGAGVLEAEAQAAQSLERLGFNEVIYYETRAADDLRRLGPGLVDAPARIFVAARLGKTRLIDNWPV